MFARLKKSLQKAGKTVEGGIGRPDKSGKNTVSETTDVHRSGSSAPRESAATPKAADAAKHSERATTASRASEHGAPTPPPEEHPAASASAAPSVPRSRAATPEHGAATTAAHEGAGQATHAASPARSPPPASLKAADDGDDHDGVHSGNELPDSDAASGSIDFDQSEVGTAGGTILFTTDDASPEGASGAGKAAASSGPSVAKAEAVVAETPAQQPAAASSAADAEVRSESTFDIHIEDDELDAVSEAAVLSETQVEPAPPSVSDTVEEEAPAVPPAKPASTSSQKSTRKEAPATSADKKAVTSGRGAAVTGKETASSRFQRETPTTSHAEKPSGGKSKARAPTPPSRPSRAARSGRDAAEIAKASSRASSATSAGRRDLNGSVRPVEERSDSDERVPSRRRARGLRAAPTEDALEDPRRHRSHSTREHARRRSADVASREGDDDRREHRSRRTREAAASSRSPVRHRTRRHSAVGKLDGAALVQDCLREARRNGHHARDDDPLPHSTRNGGYSSSQGTKSRQRRSVAEDGETVYDDRLDEQPYPPRRHRVYPDGDDGGSARQERGDRRESSLHRYEVRDAAASSPGWRSRRERNTTTPPPLREPRATSGVFHRISLYDDDGDDDRGGRDDDAYAAAAVHRPEHFRAMSELRRHRAGEDELDEEAEWPEERGPAYARSTHRSRRESEGGFSTRARSRYGERHWQGEGKDAWGRLAEHSRSVHRASDVRLDSPVRDDRPLYREGSHWDPDYYFSDAPRRHFSTGGDGAGGSWRSRSYRSPRRAPAAAPPAASSSFSAHGSPLRSRRGQVVVEVDAASSHRYQHSSSPHLTSSPMRGRRTSNVTGTGAATPVRRGSHSGVSSPVSERGLLEEVGYKLEALEQQIADDDAAREEAMRRSPFERLYHLNNRRDRDERRKKIFQLNRLERIRDRIVSGSLEEDIARREERLRKQEEMLTSPNGVFLRLYQNSCPHRAKYSSDADDSGTRHGSPNTTGVSSRPTSTTRSRLSKAETQALSKRLYEGAATTRARLEEVRKESAQERQHQQVEELLIARLVAQLQLNHARDRGPSRKPVPSPAVLEAEARAELEQLRKDDPEGFEKKVLRGRVLSGAEREAQARRLCKQGYKSKEKLSEQKEIEEMRECTFQPAINEYTQLRGGGSASARKHESWRSDDDADRDTRSSASTEQPSRRRDVDKCQELYRKGMKAKERGEELREERDRETRLSILRSRMASDHHFRRRVELDPSLAQRFMKSIVM